MTSNGTPQDVSCGSEAEELGVSMRVPQIGRSRFALPEPLELPGSVDVVVHMLVHATPCGWKPRPDDRGLPAGGLGMGRGLRQRAPRQRSGGSSRSRELSFPGTRRQRRTI